MCLADGRTSDSVGIARNVRVRIGTYTELMDLIVTPLQGYDIILGMSWFEEYNPPIDWRGKTCSLTDQQGRVHSLTRAPTGAALYHPPETRPVRLNLITSKQLERQHRKGNIDFACLVHMMIAADGSVKIADGSESPPPAIAPHSTTPPNIPVEATSSLAIPHLGKSLRGPNNESRSYLGHLSHETPTLSSLTHELEQPPAHPARGVHHTQVQSSSPSKPLSSRSVVPVWSLK